MEDSEGWSEHRTREGVSYYHNSRTGESQWERPSEFKGQSQELSRDEIQVCVVCSQLISVLTEYVILSGCGDKGDCRF